MNVAIILSGGVGSRMGLDIPKQYVLIKGQPIINYCLKTFVVNDLTDMIVIVVADEWRYFVEENLLKLKPEKTIIFALPGETRQGSIYNALKVLKENGCSEQDIVLIHDAARPLVSQKLIDACYQGCIDADAVMPVIPVKDTIYLSTDGRHINSLLNREHLCCGQAPEAFRFGKYLQIHETISKDEMLKINGSTEIAYLSGLKCSLIQGDPMNFKITTMDDLSNFEAIIKRD